MTTDKAPVTVEQGDVDMARRFMREYHMGLADTDDLAKDFASARLQSAAALEEEIKRLRGLAKANNDLARMQADEIRQLRSGNARMMDALGAIMDLPGELNLSNYDGDDVATLNASHIEAYQIARTALEGRGS